MSSDSKMFRTANIMMAGVFLLAAAVQYNDPDPVRWMAIYGLAAAGCVRAVRERLSWMFPALIGAAAFAWACMLAPAVFGKVSLGAMYRTWEMLDPAVEDAREMFGLLIVTSWMAVLVGQSWSNRSGRAPHEPSSHCY